MKDTLDELDRELAAVQDKGRKLQEKIDHVAKFRLSGMAAEKAGDSDAAIRDYEECIRRGEATMPEGIAIYQHAFERIIVLLHRRKDFSRERLYLEQLLRHDDLSRKDREKYGLRLSRLADKTDK